MKLDVWMRLSGTTVKELAEALDVSYSTAYRWKMGLMIPEAPGMRQIFRLSDGAVRPDDLVLNDFQY